MPANSRWDLIRGFKGLRTRRLSSCHLDWTRIRVLQYNGTAFDSDRDNMIQSPWQVQIVFVGYVLGTVEVSRNQNTLGDEQM